MKRFLRGCAFVFLALVLLVVGGYVVHGLVGMTEVAKAKRRAVADLATTLPAGKEQAVRDRDLVRAAVAPAWGRPAYAWQELVCEIDTVDAGWMVDHYTQRCQIRSVDLFPAATAKGDRCRWSPIPRPSGPLTRDDEVLYRATALIGPSSAFDEGHPYRLGCPDGILEPQKYVVSRSLSGSRPPSLDESPAWVVVTVETDVTTTKLGCDPWAIIFCDQPVDEPVLGDLEQAPR